MTTSVPPTPPIPPISPIPPGGAPRALVVGAGAVGTLLAALLARAGRHVVLVDRHGPPTPVRETVRVSGHDPFVAGLVRARDVASALEADATTGAPPAIPLVVLAVKMPDLDEALRSVSGIPDAPLLTVQNGVGAEELAAAARRGGPLVAGSLTVPVERTPDGVVRRGGGGLGLALAAPGWRATTRDGSADGGGSLVHALALELRSAGLRTAVLPDARAMKWSKLVANLIANATSALLALDAGEVYRDPRLFRLERRQLLEALAVAEAAGARPVRLPGANVPLLAAAVRLPEPLARRLLAPIVARARGGKAPSLRLHLDAGRGPSEVRWLNGAVVRAGTAAGIPTPVNAALAALVEAAVADPGVRGRLGGDPERLLAAIERAAHGLPHDAGDGAG